MSAPINQSFTVNVMHFLRVLRRAGLPIGTGKVLLAVEALAAIDLRVRDDVFWALHAVCVERQSQSELFRVAFDRFWTVHASRDPFLDDLEDIADPERSNEPAPLPRRVAEALAESGLGEMRSSRESELEIDSSETWSAAEQLRSKDFETMSSEELAVVKQAMTGFRLPIPDVPHRRFRPHATGRRIDMRATLRSTVRSGGLIDLKKKRRIRRHPPLAVLCDISGSMESYARMLLHFLHAVTNDRDRVHTFLFGTRLTNVSRHLAHRDPDEALAKVSTAVSDWSGGTRIGATLSQFNRQWSRRVLGQGTMVLMITDGLDREGGSGLAHEMARLQKSCRRLIWLNPLLRYDAFEPKSAGVKAMLPYVDDFRPVHNLDSLSTLAEALTDMDTSSRWLTTARA